VPELADGHDLGLPIANSNVKQLLTKFLKSRRQGISPRTIEFYEACLTPLVTSYNLTHTDINLFLSNLTCHNGKNAYYRAIRAFCNWLFRQGYVKENPIVKVDSPKMTKVILPSLTNEQVEHLIEKADNIRDKCVIILFTDSGMRLNELVNIKASHIDWESQMIIIWGKGGKQRKAPFTSRTAKMLKQIVRNSNGANNIWGIRRRGIQIMLHRLEKETGFPCNPHTFRRTFASRLHRAGLDVEHIMRLGGWESLDMVLRYTRSVKFEDSLKIYQNAKLYDEE